MLTLNILICCSFFLLVQESYSLVVFQKYTSLCGQNISLSRPNILFQIDFDVFNETNLDGPHKSPKCTSFIKWNGHSRFQLIPHATTSKEYKADATAEKIILDIRDMAGISFELNMFGPKAFFLAMIPAYQLDMEHSICPADYFFCGNNYCIHKELVCDGTILCSMFDETLCYESPSNFSLMFSFLAIMFIGLIICLLTMTYLYLRFFRYYDEQQNGRLLPPEDINKPKFYGTLNGFDSAASNESLNNNKNHRFVLFPNFTRRTHNQNNMKP